MRPGGLTPVCHRRHAGPDNLSSTQGCDNPIMRFSHQISHSTWSSTAWTKTTTNDRIKRHLEARRTKKALKLCYNKHKRAASSLLPHKMSLNCLLRRLHAHYWWVRSLILSPTLLCSAVRQSHMKHLEKGNMWPQSRIFLQNSAAQHAHTVGLFEHAETWRAAGKQRRHTEHIQYVQYNNTAHRSTAASTQHF